ncbi:MAG: acyloxyacyl hydrolase [Gammaproteobacteria bacterium]|nr:acyloxyacyl hydrolase [Gammaproteobacteria bacterium]
MPWRSPLAYRFHHISNAGLKDRNKSIDSSFLLLGYSFSFK